MTIATLLFLGTAWASDPIQRPEPPKPLDGECPKVYSINEGQPLPSPVVSPSGNAGCSAVAVPLSQFSDLLQTEEWGKALYSQYKIKVAELEMERDWYKVKLDAELKPKPWVERPSTQRWLGRLETILIVGVVSAGLGTTYYYTSGASK